VSIPHAAALLLVLSLSRVLAGPVGLWACQSARRSGVGPGRLGRSFRIYHPNPHGRYRHDHAPEFDRGTVIAGAWQNKSPDPASLACRLIVEWTADL
jgi:hypothetical protein